MTSSSPREVGGNAIEEMVVYYTLARRFDCGECSLLSFSQTPEVVIPLIVLVKRSVIPGRMTHLGQEYIRTVFIYTAFVRSSVHSVLYVSWWVVG